MQRFYTVEALKEKTIMHVFQFIHTFRHLGELTFVTHFEKVKCCTATSLLMRSLMYSMVLRLTWTSLTMRDVLCEITCCSKHYNILQTQSSLNLLGFSNTCFVVYGILQQINTKSVAKNENYIIVPF